MQTIRVTTTGRPAGPAAAARPGPRRPNLSHCVLSFCPSNGLPVLRYGLGPKPCSGLAQATSSLTAEQGLQREPLEQHTQVQELRWPWKWGANIRYFKAGTSGPPVLLVHGFGVGAWHFERNLDHLVNSGYTVYAVDLLGQGSSWPTLAALQHASPDPADPSLLQVLSDPDQTSSSASNDDHGPLRFSIVTWTEELADFTRQVIGGPAYVAGNSLGGYVSVSLAATHPELVQGLVLLNSTPFWSFRPAGDQPQGLWSLLEFDGAVPVPQVGGIDDWLDWRCNFIEFDIEGLKRTVEKLWWNNLRSRHTVESMLSMVYAHKPTVSMDPTIAERIIEATEHPAALDAFVSIVASPKSPLPFDGLLRAARCPICLVYGRQDPWVVPAWGQRADYVLTQHGCPPAMYLELDGAGHCPHHEAPATTNAALQACLQYMEQLNSTTSEHGRAGTSKDALGRPPPPIPVGNRVEVREADGREVVMEHVDGQPRSVSERMSNLVWRLMDVLRRQTSSSVVEAVMQQGGKVNEAV